MQSRLSNAIDSIPSHVMFWDKEESLIKVNELARKENASEGIQLKEGMTYTEFLTNQFSAGLYSVPENFVVEDFVKKRINLKKPSKTPLENILSKLHFAVIQKRYFSDLKLALEVEKIQSEIRKKIII